MPPRHGRRFRDVTSLIRLKRATWPDQTSAQSRPPSPERRVDNRVSQPARPGGPRGVRIRRTLVFCYSPCPDRQSTSASKFSTSGRLCRFARRRLCLAGSQRRYALDRGPALMCTLGRRPDRGACPDPAPVSRTAGTLPCQVRAPLDRTISSTTAPQCRESLGIGCSRLAQRPSGPPRGHVPLSLAVRPCGMKTSGPLPPAPD